MAIGRISGPLLKENLVRNGINLAFETDLLYLDVVNQRIGIRTGTPQHELDVNGTTRTTNLIVDNRADIADVTIENNTISTTNPYLNLATLDTVVALNKLRIDSIDIEGNAITTNSSNANLELRPNGTGSVDVHSNLNVDGNVYVTGDITADGTINIGNDNTDNVVFNADVASNIIPDITTTYSLGSDPSTGGKEWKDVWVNNIVASSVNTDTVDLDGIDLTLRQGNILYVASNGDDLKSGNHILDPYATIGKALSVAQSGDTVYIFPGEYQEVFPLTVPSGVTVAGQGIRAVSVVPTPATNNKDAFLLNGETTIENLTVKDFFYDSIANTGYAFRFAPNFAVTSRSPYVKNITVITEGSVTSSLDPRGFDAGDAGKGAFFDGSVATSLSKEASALFHSVTFITPGVDAITLTNGVRIEWLNSFTYFADRSIYAYDGLAGLYNAGKTRIRLGGVSGTFNAGDTITFTSTDSSTVVALAVDSVDGDVILINGKDEQLVGFDTTPASISNSTGATATSIENLDLKDFGAEVRLIGSASVYGNYGLVGDGAGVLMYAIGHNMAYIGTGKEVTNEPEAVIQANEVLEISGAKIRYNTVDHKGDFRVGDLFYVNQEDGTVDFAVSNFTINSTGGVTFVSNGNTTFVNGSKIETGDWRISGNTIETLTQDANFTSFGGDINLNANVNVSGNLDVTGNVTIGGNITIGDDITDTIQIVAGIDSNIVPSQDSVYSLGTLTKKWNKLWINELNVSDVQIRDNFITTVTSNADLELRANGTGNILVPNNDVVIDNNLTVTGETAIGNLTISGVLTLSGDLVQTGSSEISNNLSIGQDLFVTGKAQFEEILIDDNFITTTSSNADLELRANGTGRILIPNNDVEITNSLVVSGDVDSNNLTVSGQLSTDRFFNSDILIDDNFISSTVVNGDLELRANGTGLIYVPVNDVTFEQNLTVNGLTNLKTTVITGSLSQTGNVTQTGVLTVNGSFTNANIVIDDNVITTTESNSDLDLRANGTGRILIPNNNVEISSNLSVTGDTFLTDAEISGTLAHTGNVDQTGNISLTGNYTITGLLVSDREVQFENINIDDNVITTTASNSDLELRANGTGEILIPTNDVVITNDLRVDGTISVGDITALGTITANRFSTGDILIDDNFITTTTTNSDLELRANGTGNILIPENNLVVEQELTVLGQSEFTNVTIVGNVEHTGNTTQTGNTSITGNLVVTDVTTLSSAVQFENINIDDNVITTTASNSNLELRASGAGTILIPANDVVISNNLTVNGAFTVDNIVSVGTITANNFTTGNILIDDNFITTTNSNSSLELRANGTGSVIVSDLSINDSTISSSADIVLEPGSENVIIDSTGALKIPVGTTLERPTAATGQIRYNTSLSRFEGYTGTNWIQLTGVVDVDGDTKVTAELTEGANDNIIRFDVAGSTIVDVDATRLNATRISVDNITIDGNTISTTTNTNLVLDPQGTGSVIIDNFSIKDNTITNTVANSVTTFNNTGDGYVKISGTYGMVIPSGGNAQRPPLAFTELGQMRWNTDTSRVELFDGVNWVSAAGSASGISRADAESLAFEIVFTLG